MNKLEYKKDATFWNKKFRIIQPNLRKIDARDLDVRALVTEIKSYGASAILVNGGGIVAWYPTDNPYQIVNEYMEGDFLEKIIAESHKHDMKVLVRMDVSKSFPHVLEKHPDWFRRDPEGNVIKHWEMLTTCPTGPYWEQYNFEVLEELLNEYAVDGIFFNAFNYLKCHCIRCQKLFKDSTGFDLPTNENWDNEAWRAYVEYRYESHADYNRRLSEFINKISPGTILTIDTNITSDTYKGIRESGWYTTKFAKSNGCITSEAFNFLDRPFPKWTYWAGEEVKLGNHINQTSIILSYSQTIFSRRAAQPEIQFGYDLMQIAANGGSPAVALSGTFDQDDRKSLPITKEILTYLSKNDQEYNGMTPIADVAIIYSQRTADYYGKDNPAERWQTHYRGVYEILVESHIPFTVLHEGCITVDKLKEFSCIILPNIAALSDEEASDIDQYVEEGGHVIGTYETGLYDSKGQRRSVQALQCIDRTVKETLQDAYSYLTVTNNSILENYPETDLIMFKGEFLITEAREGSTKAITEDLYGIPSVLNTTPEFAYWSESASIPGLTIQSYGSGNTTYLPWSPDKLYHLMGVPEYKTLIAGLVKRACGSLTAEYEAPGGVECLIAKREEGGYLVHLLNAVGTQGKPLTETVNVHSIIVKIKGAYTSAISLKTGDRFSIITENNSTTFEVPNLELFDAIVIK